MRLNLHDNLDSFRERAMPLLLADEEMNCILLAQLRRAPEFDMLATVETENDVVLAATVSRPHTVVMTPHHAGAAEFLADQMWTKQITTPGVQAAAEVAAPFAETWKRLSGCTLRERVDMTLYTVEVTNAVVSPGGEFRCATMDDLPALAGFVEQFGREINEPVMDPTGHATMLIQQERLFVWVDEGQIVSMAAWAGPTPNGVRVNHVYTPPHLRGRGYATACVAKLTLNLLASGRRFVCLFADNANATSNGIYRRIGYRPLGEQKQIWFNPHG
jgi:predicted GNAT family acetyltransferase